MTTSHRRRLLFVGSLLLVAGLGYLGWRFFIADKPNNKLPANMAAAMDANLRGVGHMERFEYSTAVEDFEESLKAAPNWTPAKINLGIALLNFNTKESLDQARGIFDEVLKKEPDNPYAHYCHGIIDEYQSRNREAYEHFEAVSRIDPNDARTWVHMGMLHPQGKDSDEAKACFERALKLDPYLNTARYQLAFHPVGNSEERKKQLLKEFDLLIKAHLETENATKYTMMGHYADVIGRVADDKPPEIGPLPMFEKWDGFRVKLAEGTAWAKVGDFGDGVIGDLRRSIRERFGATIVFLDFNKDGQPDIFLASAVVRNKQIGDLLLRNDGNGSFTDVTTETGLAGGSSFGCSVADFDNDGFSDLLLTGIGAPRLFRNLANGKFEDVSAQAGFDLLTGIFLGATWFDLDQDGDLDLCLARFADTPEAALAQLRGKGGATGELLVFLNIGEAPAVPEGVKQPPITTKFQPFRFPEQIPVRGPIIGTAVGDLDGDRDVDLLILTDGQPARGIWNDRILRFRPAGPIGEAIAGTGALFLDVNHDHRSDVLLLSTDKPPVLWISKTSETPENLVDAFQPGAVNSPPLRQAQAVDIDMDSWTDVVGLSTERKPVLLQNGGAGRLVHRPDAFGPVGDALGVGVADLDGDGAADLVMLTESGLEVRRNLGNGNHSVRLDIAGVREMKKDLTLRTNADGIGAWVVAQSGSLWSGVERTTLQSGLGQSSLPLELGIGKFTKAEVVRIRWPDGVPQAELGIAAGKIVRLEESDRRPTSCPILFVWDGERYRFVTDILGAGALGEASSDGATRPPRGEESIKIEPGSLVPKDGWYRIKIAEPMDEVLYLDRVQLQVVDHPAIEKVYPDERFAAAGPPPTQELLRLADFRFAKKATDHRGADVTEILRQRDRKFVGGFHCRSWLGYAEEHWVALDFGDVAMKQGERVILCLAGWTDYPFPESIFAATQAGIELLEPRLEYQITDGTWKAWGELGFPAGLPRMMTRDVTELVALGKGRFRIRTNMRIFWDQAFLGKWQKENELRMTPLEVGNATLTSRGFAKEVLPGGRPPVVYDGELTEPVAVTHWKGRLTRLGDVTELLTQRDDRFAICGAGEEIEIAFDGRNLPPLPKGWVRSFVLRTWGYSKDASPFTLTGGAVYPLPNRAMLNYPPDKPTNANREIEEYDAKWNTRPIGR